MEIDWLFWWIIWGSILAIVGFVCLLAFILIKKGGLLSLMRFRLLGGSLIVHADKDNSIEFGLNRKAKAVETFKSLDERGKIKELPTAINKIKHHLRGTSKPVHICITGQGENINLLQQYKPDRSADHLNQWGIGMFQEGLAVGRAMREEKESFFNFGDAQTWLAIISTCLLVAVAAMQWMTLNNMAPPTG